MQKGLVIEMKICMILPHFYPYVGGGEKLFYDLGKGLVARGHEVRVVTMCVDDEYTGHKKIDGMDVWYCKWKAMFDHPIISSKDVEEHVKWCDIVHASIFTPAHIASKLARKYHKPSVLTVHEVRGTKWYWTTDFVHATGFLMVEEYSCRQPFDVYHAVSDSTKRDFHKFCGKDKKVIRVYNANEMNPKIAENSRIDVREYFDIPQTDKVFLYYGRPGQTKGIYVYLNAIRRLRERNVSLDGYKFCFILGAEPADLRRKYIKNIHKYGLEDIMLIRDSLPREDLSRCIQQADCVVVPSLTEGFGFSALEACQMGQKLIYSDGCSLPEVVYGKCLGFRNRDDHDLADKLQSVIEQGDEAFDTIPEKHFTYESMIEGIIKIYQDLMKQKEL